MQVAFKAKGTELLKAQKYIDAIDKYTEALNIMNEKISRNQVKTQQQMFELIESIKLPCLKNISLCYLKLKQYADCIITCDLILEIDSECEKTFYRKACCFIELEQFKDADSALIHAETINPESKEIKLLREKWSERKEKSTEKREQENRQKQSETKTKSIGLIATIINFVLYWIMLPLRWTQYTFDFVKKSAKNMYAKITNLYNTKILGSGSNIMADIFNKIKQTTRLVKQNVVLKVNKLVRIFVGPFNNIFYRYLSINIPLYKWLSGQSSQKLQEEIIPTRYQTE